MKKIILIFTLLLISGCGVKKSLFNPELTLLKANEDVNALKTELKGNIDKLADLRASIKSEEMTAGRDVIKHVTNDTDLMKYIIYAFLSIVLGLIGFMKWKYGKDLKEKELEKKFYKDLFLAKGVQSEDDLIKIRQMQENYKKSKGKTL